MKNNKNESNHLYKFCGIKENYDGSSMTLIELKCFGNARSFYCLPKDIKFFKQMLSKEDVKALRKLKLVK